MEAPKKPVIDDKPLPSVEPPSAGFLVQLFVIPLVIVTIIVLVWLVFSWLALMDNNPQELVRDLRTPNDASWQKALTLAELLRNRDRNDLKSDVGMATELAKVLDAQLDEEDFDENSIRLRMFLCRALGEFKVAEALPTIVKASTVERKPAEIDVRRTALKALAVFATNNGPEVLTSYEPCMESLKKASRERSLVASEKEARDNLRSTAAYVLGVLGGDEALDRLVILLDDPNTNARYNAAVGLCRHGDVRATPVLLEMLDPENEESARGEKHDSGKDWKRLQVINTGIRGAAQLAKRNSADEMQPVTAALQRIADSDLSTFASRVRHGIRMNAKEVLQSMAASTAQSQ